MEDARDRLCTEYEILGGVLSPVNDQYGLIHKHSLQAASGQHRVAMTALATQSSEWIGVSDFEVSLDKWTRVAVVLQAYSLGVNHWLSTLGKASASSKKVAIEEETKIQSETETKDVSNDNEEAIPKTVHLKFLCGSDLLRGMKQPDLWRKDHQELILGKFGVVVMERNTHPLTEEFYESYAPFQQYRQKIHAFTPCVENTISSTAVRKQIANDKSIRYLTPDPVIAYIRKEKLYQQPPTQQEQAEEN